MAAKKKDFKQLKIRGGANALLGGGVENEKPSSTLPNTKKNPDKLEIRATFIVDSEKLNLIKSISHWQRKKIKKVVDEAFTTYIREYVSSHGEIEMPEETD